MVIITYEVEKTVHNHTMQLIFELCSIIDCVFTHRVHTDEQITGEYVTLTIIKCDDISEVIMLKILHIHIKDIIIRAEYYVNITYPAYFTLSYSLKPLPAKHLLLELEFSILCKVSYHDFKIEHKSTTIKLKNLKIE